MNNTPISSALNMTKELDAFVLLGKTVACSKFSFFGDLSSFGQKCFNTS